LYFCSQIQLTIYISISIMDLMQSIIAKAKADKQRIVLPEGTEERTLQAADRLIADEVAHIILLGNPAEIKKLAVKHNLSHLDKATIIDPVRHEKKEEYARLLTDLRKSKGMTYEEAEKLVENPLYLGCLIIKNGDADGEIAGAQNTTGDVLRPALQIIKTRPGISVVSGAFLMFVQDKSYGADGVLVFADCAVMPNPTAKELAEIAVATAETTRAIVGVEPRVAMLSFSTKGSAKHELADKVIEATRLAKEMAPDLLIDGELQADAALVPFVGKSKAPGSPVAGEANVLVFPNLECGNISYKLVQRLGNAEAVGPILQGMAAPVNDLSRGSSVEDIYNMVAICANQAINK
jgi:phosphate acetyltransferase